MSAARARATVILADARVREAEENVVKALGAELNISGFRPGKAPLPVLRERLSREKIELETVHTLIPEVLQGIFAKEQITPIITPRVELRSRSPFTLVVTLVAKPEARVDVKKIQAALANGATRDDTAVLDLLADHTTVELAEELVEEEVRDLLEAHVQRLAEHGLTLEQWLGQGKKTAKELVAELRPVAEKRLRVRFGMESLIAEWKIGVSEAEMESAVTALLAPLPGTDRAKLREFYKPGKRAYEQLRFQKRVERVLERLQGEG